MDGRKAPAGTGLGDLEPGTRQRAQLRQLRDQEKQLILALLTPEQRAQYDALQAERKERRGQRGERDRQF